MESATGKRRRDSAESELPKFEDATNITNGTKRVRVGNVASESGIKERPDSIRSNTNEEVQQSDLKEPHNPKMRRDCPYLGTIDRSVIDFDFEKLCSITLSNQRPYGCLICGKFFQGEILSTHDFNESTCLFSGRGKDTHAMTHALELNHYLYINLLDSKIYCLPDNYEVVDASLDDIKYHLNPTYTIDDVRQLSVTAKYGKALDGGDYIPGCVGLNNLKQTDYFNVIIQSLCAVTPLRNVMLLLDLSHKQSPDPVLKSFSELIRKVYNPRNFKGIVSPHEFLQAVGVASGKKFRIGQQQDPLALLSWLFKRLHTRLRNRKTDDSIIHKCFRGHLQVSSCQVIGQSETNLTEVITPFLFLTLNIPQAPIFKDSFDRNVIPQMPIFEALQKYDGVTPTEVAPGELRRYTIWQLPAFLIVHVHRFSKNNFFLEKNPTIVTFPVKNLELKDYVHPDAKHLNPVTRYNLIINIIHEGKPQKGSFKAHVFHAPTNEWYEMEDLRVVPTLAQMVAVSESYVQIYQRQDVSPSGEILGQLLNPSTRDN